MNDLRLAGLIQLTEWEAGIGQGYILTDLGKEVLQNSAFLEQFKASLQTPPAETSPKAQPPGEPDAPTTYQRGETARKGYYEPEPPRVMPVLLILNLLTFGAAFVVAIRMGKPLNDFIFNGDAEVLHSAGALEATDLIHGEWWRLLTCCFLHFGLLHLGVNMYALYVLGGLEALWGSTRFLIIFCFSGLGGSCAAMIFNPGSPTAPIVLAGASGAALGSDAVFVRVGVVEPQASASPRGIGPISAVRVYRFAECPGQYVAARECCCTFRWWGRRVSHRNAVALPSIFRWAAPNGHCYADCLPAGVMFRSDDRHDGEQFAMAAIDRSGRTPHGKTGTAMVQG